jgi:hypothetical protein
MLPNVSGMYASREMRVNSSAYYFFQPRELVFDQMWKAVMKCVFEKPFVRSSFIISLRKRKITGEISGR